jgi:VWFA-related protein
MCEVRGATCDVRRTRCEVLRFAVAVCLAASLAVALGAQVPPGQQKPTFRGGVNFVRVDVYPTKDGRAVADLTRDDFEVREDGVLQPIETFERIVARAPNPEADRGELRTAEEADRAAGDPRTRLFVIFFDTVHTAGYRFAEEITYDPRTVGVALAAFLSRMIGSDDLVGLMRPEMRAETIAFTRRPSSFEEFLLSGGDWQHRFLEGEVDDTERRYQVCYPVNDPEVADFAPKMIARRREMLLLGALHNLVTHLNTLREGRKAVLVVSIGWTLYTRDDSLARPRRPGLIPGPPPIGIDKGKPTLDDPRQGNVQMADCERDRLLLSRIDDESDFRLMLDAANRANVTFYPLDPRGLTTQSSMNRRSDSLITLATATDGMALVNSNDFAPGLQRVADDLSSYYLLGYYSTNAKVDGSFRRIAVKVKRPGVTVRARRGYAARPAEIAASPSQAEAADADPETQARERTLGSLGTIRADRPLHLAAGYGWQAASGDRPAEPRLWVVADIDLRAWREAPWSSGGDATITVVAPDGQVVATEQGDLQALSPQFLHWMTVAPLSAGTYEVRVKVQPKLGAAAGVNEVLHVEVPAAPSGGDLMATLPLLFRRGPYVGTGFQPTADARFRKSERLRADIPIAGPASSLTARLLDRKGQLLSIPVTVASREESGFRFASAEVTLAPLAQADYLIEVVTKNGDRSEKMLIAFRVVP